MDTDDRDRPTAALSLSLSLSLCSGIFSFSWKVTDLLKHCVQPPSSVFELATGLLVRYRGEQIMHPPLNGQKVG